MLLTTPLALVASALPLTLPLLQEPTADPAPARAEDLEKVEGVYGTIRAADGAVVTTGEVSLMFHRGRRSPAEPIRGDGTYSTGVRPADAGSAIGLWIESPGFVAAALPVPYRAPEGRAKLDVELEPGQAVALTLRSSAGDALPGWGIELQEASEAWRVAHPLGIRVKGETDGEGRLVLGILPRSGLWKATVRAPGQAEHETFATRPLDLASRTHELVVRALGEREALESMAKVDELTASLRERMAQLVPDLEWLGPEESVAITVVGPNGNALTYGDLGGWTPLDLHARWAEGPAGRSWSIQGGQVSPGSPIQVDIEIPETRPLTLELVKGDRRWLVSAPPRGESLKLVLDPAEVLRHTAKIELMGVAGEDRRAVPGWGAHFVETRTGAEYLGIHDPIPPAEPGRLHLPPGTYDFTASDRHLGLTVGRITVEDRSDRTLEIKFPGQGAARGRLRSPYPVLALKAVSARGIGVRAAQGIVGAHALPDGRFWFTDLIAGPTALVARVITDEGVVSVAVALDLAVEPDVLNEWPDLELTEASLAGPRLRRGSEGIHFGCEIRQGGRPVHAGALLPGEVIVLPERAPAELRLMPSLLAQQPSRVLTVYPREDDLPLDF